jgi:hypothetical protein
VVTNRLVSVSANEPTQVLLTGTDRNSDALTFWTRFLPLHGMVTDLDPASGTLTYVPAWGYSGLDRFTYQATDSALFSPVATIAINVVAPADNNGNGLPDSWETTYGITAPEADADGDGQHNRAEYLANTNPTNAASVFKLLSANWEIATDEAYTNAILTLTWSSVGGTRYRVQYSEAVNNGPAGGDFTDIVREAATEMDPAPYGIASEQSFTEKFAQATNTGRYYRVRVLP